jgi:hypothetical protein
MKTHDGRSRHPLYKTWEAMKARVDNPKCSGYSLYGGRGVKIAKRWRKDFWAFVEDMGLPPSFHDHRLDRWPDPDGDFTPDNCRWVSRAQKRKEKATKAMENKPLSKVEEMNESGRLPDDFRELLVVLADSKRGRPQLAADLNRGYWTILNWDRKNNVPEEDWESLMQLSAKRGLKGIDADYLRRIALKGMPISEGRGKYLRSKE